MTCNVWRATRGETPPSRIRRFASTSSRWVATTSATCRTVQTSRRRGNTLRERFPDRRDRGIANFVGYGRQFLYDMQPGDLVALSLSAGRVAIGCVKGGYRCGPSAPDRIGHARAVKWLVSDLPRVRFGHDINATFESRGTVCRIRAQGPERRLRPAADTGNEPRE